MAVGSTVTVLIGNTKMEKIYKIKFDIPEHEIQAEIKKQMEKSISDKIGRTISNLFTEPMLRQTGLDKGGFGTQLISEMSETALLSEKTQQRIQNGIEKYLETHLDEAIQQAMQRRINHEVGKVVFMMKLKDLITREQIENIAKNKS